MTIDEALATLDQKVSYNCQGIVTLTAAEAAELVRVLEEADKRIGFWRAHAEELQAGIEARRKADKETTIERLKKAWSSQ